MRRVRRRKEDVEDVGGGRGALPASMQIQIRPAAEANAARNAGTRPPSIKRAGEEMTTLDVSASNAKVAPHSFAHPRLHAVVCRIFLRLLSLASPFSKLYNLMATPLAAARGFLTASRT